MLSLVCCLEFSLLAKYIYAHTVSWSPPIATSRSLIDHVTLQASHLNRERRVIVTAQKNEEVHTPPPERALTEPHSMTALPLRPCV